MIGLIKKDMQKKKQILGDHKKKGSKFIPPMLQLDKMNEISYINQILPEIIWMGLLNDKFGYKKGIEVSTKLAKFASELSKSKKKITFALSSSYNRLSKKKKKLLKFRLKKENSLVILQDALKPLLILYKDFPMSFLKVSRLKEKREILLEIMKRCISRHINKYNTPALVIQANLIYIRGITGSLYFTSNVRTPDLDAILMAPESEEGKHASAFVRSAALTEVASLPGRPGRQTDMWARSFWNQGYKLDKCNFSQSR